MSPSNPPELRRKGELTAERTLDAAEGLFAERGYAGTTLRDVATAVGIRIPSLYNHFDSKEQLYAAVLDRGIGPILRMLDRFVEAPEAQRPEPSQLIAAVMELLAAHPNLPRLLLQETLSGGQRLTPALRRRLASIFSKAHATVEARDEDRRWAKDQIPLVVLALYHTVVGYHTIAPLYRELIAVDLLSEAARADQTRFLTELSQSLFERAPRKPRRRTQ
jgi:TetR/AcrR family transcriptional regulator